MEQWSSCFGPFPNGPFHCSRTRARMQTHALTKHLFFHADPVPELCCHFFYTLNYLCLMFFPTSLEKGHLLQVLCGSPRQNSLTVLRVQYQSLGFSKGCHLSKLKAFVFNLFFCQKSGEGWMLQKHRPMAAKAHKFFLNYSF